MFVFVWQESLSLHHQTGCLQCARAHEGGTRECVRICERSRMQWAFENVTIAHRAFATAEDNFLQAFLLRSKNQRTSAGSVRSVRGARNVAATPRAMRTWRRSKFLGFSANILSIYSSLWQKVLAIFVTCILNLLSRLHLLTTTRCEYLLRSRRLCGEHAVKAFCSSC